METTMTIQQLKANDRRYAEGGWVVVITGHPAIVESFREGEVVEISGARCRLGRLIDSTGSGFAVRGVGPEYYRGER